MRCCRVSGVAVEARPVVGGRDAQPPLEHAPHVVRVAESAVVGDGLERLAAAFERRAASTRARSMNSRGVMPAACVKWRAKLRALMPAMAASLATL